MTKAQVEKSIRNSFRDVIYPGDSNLVVDENHPYGDQKAIANLLRGKQWKQLTRKELFSYDIIMVVMTPDAFLYYLPAFLIFCLDAEEADFVYLSLIALLAPIPSRNHRAGFEARTRNISSVQSCAISLFYEYSNQQNPDELEAYIDYDYVLEYWKKRCSNI